MRPTTVPDCRWWSRGRKMAGLGHFCVPQWTWLRLSFMLVAPFRERLGRAGVMLTLASMLMQACAPRADSTQRENEHPLQVPAPAPPGEQDWRAGFSAAMQQVAHGVHVARGVLPRAPDPAAAGYTFLVELDAARDQSRWFDKASILADRDTLESWYSEHDYVPVANSLALVAIPVPGVEQPRMYWYSWGDTGFIVPQTMFHPASTVKLGTTVAALMFAARQGLTGEAYVEFDDVSGNYSGRIRDIYYNTLMFSSNADYNRLGVIAGFDTLNNELLSPRWGLPNMAIQSRYGGRGRGAGFRNSPEIEWREGSSEGVIPERNSEAPAPDCVGNCTTLFELQEILRRVMLHHELPVDERFPIADEDIARIHEHLLITRDRLQSAPEDTLGGENVQVFNNVGRIPGTVLVENAFLLQPGNGRRAFAAVSIGFPRALGDDSTNTVSWLTALCRNSLLAVLDRDHEGPGLQHNAGIPMEVTVSANGESAAALLRVDVRVEDADRVVVWRNRERVAEVRPEQWNGIALPFYILPDIAQPAEPWVLTVEARRGEEAVSYQAWWLAGAATP